MKTTPNEILERAIISLTLDYMAQNSSPFGIIPCINIILQRLHVHPAELPDDSYNIIISTIIEITQ